MGSVLILGAVWLAVDPARIVVVETSNGSWVSVGTGYLVDRSHVLTAAHTVRGGTTRVLHARHCSVRATLCSTDPSEDWAYLHVPPHGVAPVRFGVLRPGERVDIAVLHRVGQPTTPAVFRARPVTRVCLRWFVLGGVVRQGDSGAAVVSPDGSVAGVVWGVAPPHTYAAPVRPPR